MNMTIALLSLMGILILAITGLGIFALLASPQQVRRVFSE